MDADNQSRIRQRDWFHSIEVAPGIVTPGRVPLDYLRGLVQRCALPDSLAGLRVLDVGAWDGFFSFEAERRGAREVVALDIPPVDRKGFAIARELLGSRVHYERGSVYDLSPARHGTFDLVLFLRSALPPAPSAPGPRSTALRLRRATCCSKVTCSTAA